MSPLERVLRTRRALGAAIATRAVLWAAAAAFIVAAVATLAVRSGGAGDALAWGLAAVAGIAVLVASVMPARRLTVPDVALWIEERVPVLDYALVTAVDPAHADAAVTGALERQIAKVSWRDQTRRAIGRALVRPAAATVLATLVLIAARRAEFAASPARGGGVFATTSPSASSPAPFARLAATVRPPAYTGAPEVTIESPASVASLVGSVITLHAPGRNDGISASVDGRPLAVLGGGTEWRVTHTLGDRPAIVRLHHSLGDRMVALEPRPDSAPVVRLSLPPRDTVLRVAAGTVALAAEVHDDIGLTNGGFEYIVSSGEGESFQFRSGTLGAKTFARALTGSLSGTLDLSALQLKPGDIVHLRAVARDANSVSGPGVGASETRVVRIARASEYDSLAVEGAPPPEADKSLISQRMLIILTEALERRRPRLSRETLQSESRAIGRDQTRLRRRVGDIIFARLGDDPSGEHAHGPDEEPHENEPAPRTDSTARDSLRRAMARAGQSARAIAAADSADSARAALLRAAEAATKAGEEILDFQGDETPIVAINRPLLEAYNAMWEASRELEQGEPGRALPPMRRALAAIQRARQAERIYLRGKAPAVVVDLARVRLTGKESGAPNTRAARPPADPAAVRRAERLATAMTLAASEPVAAIDSLVLLRVESLDAAPSLAAALNEVIDALREGRDAAPSLSRARRVAEGTVRGSAGLRSWSGVW